ncbi:MAG: hypothetical protein HDS81_00705 [Bacteroidales bacterium]|nr:hypothetical protein [Bacteroidales bacterium]MBD5252708.1 hypothetical protein [Barnesiella sp.]
MQIYVDNKLAALKKGTSFEYVAENRLFSGSDGYTLTITFPLNDCPENIAIFGHVNRADVTAQKVIKPLTTCVSLHRYPSCDPPCVR